MKKQKKGSLVETRKKILHKWENLNHQWNLAVQRKDFHTANTLEVKMAHLTDLLAVFGAEVIDI